MCTARVLAEAGAAQLLDEVERSLAALGTEVLGGAVTDEALEDTVRRLARVTAMAQAEKLRRVAEINDRRVDTHPSRQATRLMGVQPGLSRSEARAEAATARALRRLPKTASAFADGRLTQSQAREAARGLADLDSLAEQGVDLPDDAAGTLDDLVVTQPPDADRGQIRRAVDEWAHQLSGKALADRERRAHANRRLWIGPAGPDGTAPIEGRLDVLGRATLAAALDALSRPAGPDDTRSFQQRRHDALVALGQRALDAGDLPAVAAQRPHLIVTTTDEALTGLPDAPPAVLDGYGPISSETARMVACDGEVTEIVVDFRGRPLQVKETGTPTRKQRLAALVRDGCCVGCGAPASQCQLHHVRWRRHKGATVVENLVLVCFACHHAIHHEGWQIHRTADGRYVARPPADSAIPPAGLRHSA